MKKLLPASLVLAMAAPGCALAQSAPDVQALRQEIQTLRADYDARLRALEQRLDAALASSTPPPSVSGTVPAPAAVAATAPPVVAPPSPLPSPAPTRTAAGPNAFNPTVSLILSGVYARTSQDPSDYAITGFPVSAAAEVGPGTRGFSLAESELGLAANIDPWLRGAANISFHPDDTVSVEEAYVQTTSLGQGLVLKAGRFFSGIGYLNSQHSHTWDFVDAPLAYQGMLGGQYGDDGVQLTWLAPIDQYVEFGVELGRGRSFPGSDSSFNGAGMRALTLHGGGDVGDSSSWRAGLSVLNARAADQLLPGANGADPSTSDAFSGRTRVWVADGVWKWAPHGDATRTNFKLQGEYLQSTRDGTLVGDITGAALAAADHRVQSGGYMQAIYQFMPRWRVGWRGERLTPGAGIDYHPERQSLMVDFSASEFSRVRLQVARDKAREGASDKQLFVQYQMSLGAHGAHTY